MISKPENDFPPLQKIEWEDKMNYFLVNNQRPPMSKANVVRILKNATKCKGKSCQPFIENNINSQDS